LEKACKASKFGVMKLHILMLCVRFPYPPKDGGSIAMHNMIETLHEQGHKVTVLAMNTPKHYVHVRNLPQEILEMAEFHAVDINTQPSYIDAMANFVFSKKSYHVQRFTSRGFQNTLKSLLKDREFDIIQLETLYMTPYLPTLSSLQKNAKIVLRAHNIEHEIWERKARNEHAPWKQYYFEITAGRLKAYEKAMFTSERMDAIVTVSGRDEGIIKGLKPKIPIKTSLIGIDTDKIEKYFQRNKEPEDTSHSDYEKKEVETSVFYIGALDWMPNTEGLDWFLNKIWPEIHSRYPKVKFYVAGRNMSTQYQVYRRSNVISKGEVEDAYDYMSQYDIMVVPLLTGSGMRVKIIEGMALKKAIVATSLAVEGIDPQHGKHLFIANTVEDFVRHLSVLIEKPGMRNVLGRNAHELVLNKFDNRKIVKDLVGFYSSLLKD